MPEIAVTTDAATARRPCVPWSEHDLQVLRDHYLSGGLRAVRPRLETKRSDTSLMNKTRELGLRRQEHDAPAASSDAIDDAIRKVYARPVTVKGKGRIDHYTIGALAARIGRSRQWIHSRALKINATRAAMAMNWSDDELQILADAEGLGLVSIRRRLLKAGFSRTPQAIACAMSRHGLQAHEDDPDRFAASHVSRMLGTNDKTVARWIDSGKLKADRDAPHATYRIYRADLRRFLIDHQSAWDHRKATQWWLVEILSGQIPR